MLLAVLAQSDEPMYGYQIAKRLERGGDSLGGKQSALYPVLRNLHAGGLLDSFVQAYYVTARTATELRTSALADKDLVARVLERARRAYLEGTISRPESASRTLVETALAWLVDEELVARGQGKKGRIVTLAADGGSEPLQLLIDRIQPFL